MARLIQREEITKGKTDHAMQSGFEKEDLLATLNAYAKVEDEILEVCKVWFVFNQAVGNWFSVLFHVGMPVLSLAGLYASIVSHDNSYIVLSLVLLVISSLDLMRKLRNGGLITKQKNVCFFKGLEDLQHIVRGWKGTSEGFTAVCWHLMFSLPLGVPLGACYAHVYHESFITCLPGGIIAAVVINQLVRAFLE